MGQDAMNITRKRFHLLLKVLAKALMLLQCACAATIGPPAQPNPDMDWQQTVKLPRAIHDSLQGSRLLMIPGKEGVVIPVRLFGPDGDKSPLVMVHGLQSHSGWFAQSAAFIAGLGHPVYVIDRRGSGLSQMRRGDAKDFMAWGDDIHTVTDWALRRHGHRQIFMLGHCFGAIPATLFAETSPDLVRGLILTTPGIFTHTSIPFSEMLKIVMTSTGQRDYYFPVPLEANQFSELPEYEPFIASDPLALRAVTGDLYWQIYKARQYLEAHTELLTMPVLAGFAGEDEIADNQMNQQWLAKVPAQARTEIVYPDARHILEFSQERDLYFKDLANWLAWIETR